MYRFILLIFSFFLCYASPLLAQQSSKKESPQAFSDSRASNSSSIFEAKEGRSAKKSTLSKRKKNTKSLKKQAYKSRLKKGARRKGGSDCDCPGSKKAKKKRRK